MATIPVFISAVLIFAAFLPDITDAASPMTFVANLIPAGKAGKARNYTLDGKATIVITNSTYAVGTFSIAHIDKLFAAGLSSLSEPGVSVWAFNSSSNGKRVPTVSGKFNQSWSFNPSISNITNLLSTGQAIFALFNTKHPKQGAYRGLFQAARSLTRGGGGEMSVPTYDLDIVSNLAKLVNFIDDDFNLQILGQGKKSIFADFSKLDCIDGLPDRSSSQTTTSFSSQQEFSSSVEASLDIAGSGWGVSVEASASYKSASQGSQSTTGVQMRWYQYSKSYAIKDSCKIGAPFDKAFKYFWDKLPLTCDTETDCKKYFDFSKNYGTHVIESIKTGSNLQFYATATKSSSVSSSQIQAALKAEYDGGAYSAGGSASFQMNDEQKKVSSETSKRTIVTGGVDDGVRTKLIANGDKKPVNADIQAFLEEGKRSSVAASRTFRGIWDIMSNRFSEDGGIITTSSDDDVTKAALFKKLALTTNYFADGKYPPSRSTPQLAPPSSPPPNVEIKSNCPAANGWDGRYPAGNYYDGCSYVYWEGNTGSGTLTADCPDNWGNKKENRLELWKCCRICNKNERNYKGWTDVILGNYNGVLKCEEPKSPYPSGCP